ncbi:MAG: beta-N-acetylhexosaminidase [Candidatus Latescibacterota bacterium]|nr:MAG: beta-N-acetylhexosaminidase [Candidatus Latescibacterota bacterium]
MGVADFNHTKRMDHQKRETIMKLSYDPNAIAPDLKSALSILSEEYPLVSEPSETAIRVVFHPTDQAGALEVKVGDGTAHVHYSDLAQACRGVGWLLGLEDGDEKEIHEQAGFGTMGLMLDCSRNAVMTVGRVKKWLRRMALSGYNILMLYTEDTYQLPDEPLFGYLRGAYTLDEIRGIDDYAAALGIELIPCVQALGHLEQILKWRGTYAEVRDTSSVLLVDKAETYALIGKMLRFWSQAVRSRRIHIGMDETHDLGRGRYMDLFGYKRGFDIFNGHLSKVVQLCMDQGLHPMIWSDMYFRMGSKTGGYYDTESRIPDEVAAAIPREAQLVYWDYYHTTEEFYEEWIKRHRNMGFEPVMASGIWTWGRFVYSHAFTSQTALPCVRACLKEGLKEIIFTMWKDDGGGVDFDSALTGVLYAAEAAYNGGQVSEDLWASRFKGVCKADLTAQLRIPELDPCTRYEDGEVKSRMLLWDDPLFGMVRKSLLARKETENFDPAAYYEKRTDDLSPLIGQDEGEAGDLEFAHQLAHTVALKARMYDRLIEAYGEKDRESLCSVADEAIPEVASELKKLWQQHRRVWMAQNKPFGFEVQCIRYGGLILRLEEVGLRIREYLSGEVEQIEELEEPLENLAESFNQYKSVATASCIL